MSVMESPKRSQALRSTFQEPPKSYHQPAMKPGYWSICGVGMKAPSEPLVRIACRKKRSSTALTCTPAAIRRVSSAALNMRLAIENSTNCELVLPRYSSRPKNGLSLPPMSVNVGQYLTDPSGQSQPQPLSQPQGWKS